MFSFITESHSTTRIWRKTKSTYTSLSGPPTIPTQPHPPHLSKTSTFTSTLKADKQLKSSQLKKTPTTMRSKFSVGSFSSNKWNKIVDLYNLPSNNSQPNCNHYSLKPGISFYRLLANTNLLTQYSFRINFPQTFIEIQGELFLISTNKQTGELQSTKLQSQKYSSTLHQILQTSIQQLSNFHYKYKSHYDYRKNIQAPILITKLHSPDKPTFQVNVQNYKIFTQKKIYPTSTKLIQKYIYPRNMQAIIIRICYTTKGTGIFNEQLKAERFQNVHPIFQINTSNQYMYQLVKLNTIINANYDQVNNISFCKLNSLKGLEKFIQQSKQLIWFLQLSQKIQISKIYIDFTIDLYNNPWLLNLKKLQYSEIGTLSKSYKMLDHHTALLKCASFGVCKLCSLKHLKKDLKKAISNKMFLQYLSHLKKRLKILEYQKLQFIKSIILPNLKNYTTIKLCQPCYTLIMQQYQLIQQQHKLAKIWSINPQQLQNVELQKRPMDMPNQLKQWRLMLYVVGISNLPSQYLYKPSSNQFTQSTHGGRFDTTSNLSKDKKTDPISISLKYTLSNSPTITHSWHFTPTLSSTSSQFSKHKKIDLNIKKVKMHYFYSQSQNIDTFLKSTQINFQLSIPNKQQILAQGSSSTLSSFTSQYDGDLCLRQTSSVLLFYNCGQYCQLTIKVGLICDGLYLIPQNLFLTQLNKVYFAQNTFTNSNQIPKQWMQAFGVIEDCNMNQIYNEQIDQKQNIKYKQQNVIKDKIYNKKLSRKSFHLYV